MTMKNMMMMTLQIIMMILICFLCPKGPQTILAPVAKTYDYDNVNKYDEDDGHNDVDVDNEDVCFKNIFFCV